MLSDPLALAALTLAGICFAAFFWVLYQPPDDLTVILHRRDYWLRKLAECPHSEPQIWPILQMYTEELADLMRCRDSYEFDQWGDVILNRLPVEEAKRLIRKHRRRERHAAKKLDALCRMDTDDMFHNERKN